MKMCTIPQKACAIDDASFPLASRFRFGPLYLPLIEQIGEGSVLAVNDRWERIAVHIMWNIF